MEINNEVMNVRLAELHSNPYQPQSRLGVDEKTYAAIAALYTRDIIEINSEGGSYTLSDKGIDKAWALLESHSDEEKVMIFSLVELLILASEHDEDEES